VSHKKVLSIYVSDSLNDSNEVALIRSSLEGNNVAVVTAWAPLGEGTSQNEMEALSQTDYFLLIVSKDLSKSQWARSQIAAAFCLVEKARVSSSFSRLR
jgi:hypothetical protein